MQLKKAGADGHWFVFKRGDAEDGSQDVRFKVRRLSGPEARQIAYQVGGTRRQFGQKGTTVDVSKNFQTRLAQGVAMLLDSKNAEWPVSAEDAGPLREALKKDDLKPGDVVLLDGSWSEQVKRIVLADATAILDFVHKKDEEMEAKADEEEQEALGN